MEASDGFQGLPGGTAAGVPHVRAIDMAGMEKQRSRFRPADRELFGILRALDSRSADRNVSARRADNGRAVLEAGNAAARPVNTLAGIAGHVPGHAAPSASLLEAPGTRRPCE